MGRGVSDLPLIIFPLIVVSSLLLYSLLSGRVEIREKGLAYSGRLVPWSLIQSNVWDPNPGKFEILRLRTSGLWSWWPSRIRVRKEFRAQFDDALTRKLME
jgi:hypothetical protein